MNKSNRVPIWVAAGILSAQFHAKIPFHFSCHRHASSALLDSPRQEVPSVPVADDAAESGALLVSFPRRSSLCAQMGVGLALKTTTTTTMMMTTTMMTTMMTAMATRLRGNATRRLLQLSAALTTSGTAGRDASLQLSFTRALFSHAHTGWSLHAAAKSDAPLPSTLCLISGVSDIGQVLVPALPQRSGGDGCGADMRAAHFARARPICRDRGKCHGCSSQARFDKIEQVVCAQCSTRQPVSNTCTSCGIQFGSKVNPKLLIPLPPPNHSLHPLQP